jgi:hypothetical protein
MPLAVARPEQSGTHRFDFTRSFLKDRLDADPSLFPAVPEFM